MIICIFVLTLTYILNHFNGSGRRFKYLLFIEIKILKFFVSHIIFRQNHIIKPFMGQYLKIGQYVSTINNVSLCILKLKTGKSYRL